MLRGESGKNNAKVIFIAGFLPQSSRLASSWFVSIIYNSGSYRENYDSESHCCGHSNVCVAGISCVSVLSYSGCNEERVMSLLVFTEDLESKI